MEPLQRSTLPTKLNSSLSYAAAALLLALNFWLIRQNSLPVWIQPSCVGMLWGCTFFAGFAAKGSVFRGPILGIALACAFVWTAKMALSGITDIPAPECLVILCLIVAFGWVIATRDNKSSVARPEIQGAYRPNSGHFGNFSIMDICMLTTVVACLLNAIPRLTVHPLFFFALMVSMAMGVTACWLVVRWVCYDAWTPKLLYWMAVPIILGGAICILLAPEGQNAKTVMGWMISGPIAVITSQSMVVMLLLAIHRFETDPDTFRRLLDSPKARI